MDDEYCDIAAGAAGGSCAPVMGVCGYAAAHAWVAYECGDEAGCPACPSGEMCVDHGCEPARLVCPESAPVGSTGSCSATVAEEPCSECDFIVTDPSGRQFLGKTGADGSIELPMNLEGVYKVSILKDGEVVAEMEIDAISKAMPPEPPKPGLLEDPGSLAVLLLLLLVIIALVFYWRTRSGKKGKR
jgi:hypothetical protein